MPYTYLPGPTFLTINGDVIELIHQGEVVMSMTAEEARSNAEDLINAADKLEGKGDWAARPTDADIEQGYVDAAAALDELYPAWRS